jgi:phosphinothricin acetyltransferase
MDTEGRTPEQQRVWMETHNGSPYPLLVAETETQKAAVGYAALSAYNPKPGYARTAETSVYLHPDWQGRRIGSRPAGAPSHRSQGARIPLPDRPDHRRQRGIAAPASPLRLYRCRGTLRRVGEKFGRELDVVTLQLLLDETIK